MQVTNLPSNAYFLIADKNSLKLLRTCLGPKFIRDGVRGPVEYSVSLMNNPRSDVIDQGADPLSAPQLLILLVHGLCTFAYVCM